MSCSFELGSESVYLPLTPYPKLPMFLPKTWFGGARGRLVNLQEVNAYKLLVLEVTGGII